MTVVVRGDGGETVEERTDGTGGWLIVRGDGGGDVRDSSLLKAGDTLLSACVDDPPSLIAVTIDLAVG